VPQARRHDRVGPSTRCAVRESRPPPPQPSLQEGAPGCQCVCRQRRVASAARQSSTRYTVCALRPPSPAIADGRRAPDGCQCVCRQQRVASAARQTSTRCDLRLPSSAIAGGRRAPGGHVCAAGGPSRSLRDVHALCRPHVATVLPSRRWRRECALRLMYVPQMLSARCHTMQITEVLDS
jgi:hypothetical protein